MEGSTFQLAEHGAALCGGYAPCPGCMLPFDATQSTLSEPDTAPEMQTYYISEEEPGYYHADWRCRLLNNAKVEDIRGLFAPQAVIRSRTACPSCIGAEN